MKRQMISFAAAAAVAASSLVSAIPISAEDGGGGSVPTAAFRGAEGGGMYTKGARAALDNGDKIEVYHVTNLNDSGAGSFRDAVSRGNRIVVFDVSGYVDLEKNVTIGGDNITILGQTAPGGGICFRSNNIKIGADNVILRYIRFRVGAHDKDGNDTRAQDGLEVTDNCQNVIIDHCSVSWGTDENLSAYAVKDVTIQNCVIAESLNQSVHDKGEHSYAAIWGGVNLSVHHNLIATHKSRNPKIGTSETVSMTDGFTDSDTLVDIKNNIIYNWGDKAGYGSENGAHTYIVNNIYRPGPATPSGKRARIFELSVGSKYEPNMLGSVYADGNLIDVDDNDPDCADAQKVNAENWQDDAHIGVYVDNKYYGIADSSNARIETPDAVYQNYESNYPITLDDTHDVYEKVLAGAGATLPRRDAVDERIINDVKNRTAPTGSKGSAGLLDDPTDIAAYDGRGYPEMETVTRAVSDYDSDADGIPDEWEDKMGLDRNNKTDGTALGPDGYTWLEIYVEDALSNSSPADLSVTVEEVDALRFNDTPVTLTANVTGTASRVVFYSGKTAVAEAEDNGDGTWTARAILPCGDNRITAKACSGGGYVLSPAVYVSVAHSNSTDDSADENTIASYNDGFVTVKNGSGFTGGAVIAGAYENGKLKELKTAELDASNTAYIGDMTSDHVKIFLWDSLGKMTPLSDARLKTELWSRAGGAGYSRYEYILPNNSSLKQSVSGDFKLMAKLDELPCRFSGVEVGICCGDAAIYKYYDADFNQKIACRIGGNTTIAELTADKYSYLAITRIGDEVSLCAGTNPADLEDTVIGKTTVFGSASAGAYVSGAEGELTVAGLEELKLAVETSRPSIVLDAPNQLLLTGDSVIANVAADGAAITEVWIYLDGKPVASRTGLNITGSDSVMIPVEFDTPCRGTVTAYCFDENLGRGEDSADVAITQDTSPWELFDVGEDISKPSYVLATGDYTYKIGDASDGGIGGTEDRFAFLNQWFEGDTRLYARIRLQGAKQMGFTLKNDRSPSSPIYWFGAETVDGNVHWRLIKRDADGAEAEVAADVTDVINDKDKAYIVAEKKGGEFNIYKTANDANLYKVNTLIASVPCAGIDEDGCYMGFGAVSDGTAVPDAGWLGIESVSGTRTTWSFDNGLDWMWQAQEPNILAPLWASHVNGNHSGVMRLETNGDYTSERYVFREYIHGDGYKVIRASADICADTPEAGINLYLNAGTADSGFKAVFDSDGCIGIGDEKTEYAYEPYKWYTVSWLTDEGAAPGMASITIKETYSGKIIADIPETAAVPMRAQNNTEKKTPVTSALFFEPIAGNEGTYYIDNVCADVTDSSVRIEKTESWYTFGGLTEINGAFAVDGTAGFGSSEPSGESISVAAGAELKTGKKSAAGYDFTNRIRIKNDNGKITLPVSSGAEVTVYAASANSSSTRPLYIDGQKYDVLSADAFKYVYDGEDGTIEIYAGDNIEIYGISVILTTLVE